MTKNLEGVGVPDAQPVADERRASDGPPPYMPHETGVGEWCAPGPAAEQVRRWVLRFDDPDRGEAIFDNEQDARKAFAGAEGRGWNCHLFAHVSRAALAAPQPAAVLEKAWRSGWAACRDAEYVGEEAENEAWHDSGISYLANLANDAEQSVPAQPQPSGNAGGLPVGEKIRNAFAEGFGLHAGWQGIEGSWFTEGYMACHRAALAAQPSAPTLDVDATAERIARHVAGIDGGRLHEPTYRVAQVAAKMGIEAAQPSGQAAQSSQIDVDAIMTRAQDFARTWSAIGGLLDPGTMRAKAEEIRENLRAMLTAAASVPVVRPSGQAQQDADLWCLHMQGPDDVHAAPSNQEAVTAAAAYNVWMTEYLDRQMVGKTDAERAAYPRREGMLARVVPYPGTAEEHAAAVRGWNLADWMPKTSQDAARQGVGSANG